VFEGALEGRVDAIRELREAIEGKAAQRIETPDAQNREVNFRVVYTKESRRADSVNEKECELEDRTGHVY
jgi:predicted RNA-binding protein with PIN domain